MLFKCSGKYIEIYFNFKITFFLGLMRIDMVVLLLLEIIGTHARKVFQHNHITCKKCIYFDTTFG